MQLSQLERNWAELSGALKFSRFVIAKQFLIIYPLQSVISFLEELSTKGLFVAEKYLQTHNLRRFRHNHLNG